MATEGNTVYALDAGTGGEVWKRSLGKPAPLSSLPCGNIDPLGITGTPVIDEGSGIYDAGIVPLAHFVDDAGPTAAAAAVEIDRKGRIVPVLYIRRKGGIEEHLLPAHPLHDFDGGEQRREVEARLKPLLG